MPSTLAPSASGTVKLGLSIIQRETEATAVTPGKEQQVLPTAEAAVFEAWLAEDGLGAQMLGDFGQVPKCFWANFSGHVNGNSPTFCFTFNYQRV